MKQLPFPYTLKEIKAMVHTARTVAMKKDPRSRSYGPFLGTTNSYKGPKVLQESGKNQDVATPSPHHQLGYYWQGTLRSIFRFLQSFIEIPDLYIHGLYGHEHWKVKIWDRKSYIDYLRSLPDLPTYMGIDPWLDEFIEEALAATQNSLALT